MIEENVETYSCEEKGCGRKFESVDKLMDHYKRRHKNLYEKHLSGKKPDDKSKKLLDELYDKINDIEKNAENLIDYDDIEKEVEKTIIFNEENINFKEETNSMKSKSNSMSLTTSENFSNQNQNQKKVTVITDEMIGVGSKYADYDEIDEIDLHDRNIYCFRTKTNVNFTYLLYITTIDLSHNHLKDISHIKHLTTLKFVNISSNKIDDISEFEYLEELETLNAENNDIMSISTLGRCKELHSLQLANNKIKYESSTYKTLQNLQKLKELTIRNNPFLLEVFGYKHFFICKYPKINKLDGEQISELDREIAVKFTQENSNNNENNAEKPQSAFGEITSSRSKKVITQIEYKPKVSPEEPQTNSNKKLHPLKVIKKSTMRTNSLGKEEDKSTDFKMSNPANTLQRELEELRNENKVLADKNKSYEMEIQSLKLELENSLSLVKEYERLMEENNVKMFMKEDEEKKRLKDEVELWKREYCDLLDKSMSTNVSTSRLLTNGSDRVRPQTAQVKGKKDFLQMDYLPYEKTLEDLSNFKNESMRMKRKNSLDDSLNHSEEDEDGESDQEIDDLLRKSVTNLSHLKTEIKVLSKAADSNRSASSNSKLEQVKNRSLSRPKIMKDTIEVKNKLFNINKK